VLEQQRNRFTEGLVTGELQSMCWVGVWRYAVPYLTLLDGVPCAMWQTEMLAQTHGERAFAAPGGTTDDDERGECSWHVQNPFCYGVSA